MRQVFDAQGRIIAVGDGVRLVPQGLRAEVMSFDLEDGEPGGQDGYVWVTFEDGDVTDLPTFNLAGRSVCQELEVA